MVSYYGFNVNFPDNFSYAYWSLDILFCEIPVFLILICRTTLHILDMSSLIVTFITDISSQQCLPLYSLNVPFFLTLNQGYFFH